MNKEDILDWVITFEDKELKNLRENVVKTAETNYGKIGREVAEKYYRQIDGEEEFDDPDIEDCDDCKERAKKLLKIADSVKYITDVLTSDLLDNLSKDVNIVVLKTTVDSLLTSIVENLLNKSCFKLDDNKKEDLKKKLLLDVILCKEDS